MIQDGLNILRLERIFFSIYHEAKTFHGKQKHALHECSTCKDLCHMFVL
jgi:hypothetical protein